MGIFKLSAFVNFDPANMILYGTGEPIEALRKIGDRVAERHDLALNASRE